MYVSWKKEVDAYFANLLNAPLCAISVKIQRQLAVHLYWRTYLYYDLQAYQWSWTLRIVFGKLWGYSGFYAVWLLYHNVVLPYKIRQNRFTVAIAQITESRWTFKSDVTPRVREESVALNPPRMANVGLHSSESATVTTHKNEYWRRKW